MKHGLTGVRIKITIENTITDQTEMILAYKSIQQRCMGSYCTSSPSPSPTYKREQDPGDCQNGNSNEGERMMDGKRYGTREGEVVKRQVYKR